MAPTAASDAEERGDSSSDGDNRDNSQTPPPIDEAELDGLSLFEKKARLVNNEIDYMGMGRYQWILWSLCGLGYLLDLLWAQTFGLILTQLQQELGIPANQGGNISTAFAVGLTAGAAFWGAIVDIIGRRWAFNLTTLCAASFGIGLAAAQDYTTFLILAAFVGFGVGGNIPVDTTIALEFLPQNRRNLLPLLSIFQPIGVVLTTLFAYVFIPDNSCAKGLPSCNFSPPDEECCGMSNNMGWRYTIITVASITVLAFVLRTLAFTFHESPKFLIYRGQEQAAITVLQKVSKFNGHESRLSSDHFDHLTKTTDTSQEDENPDENTPMLNNNKNNKKKADWKEKMNKELDRYRYLFSNWTLARLTLLVWITYACDFWGFTISATFTPQILLAKGAANGQTIYDTYRSYIYVYLPGVFGVLLGVYGYQLPRVGKLYTMIISSALMAASLIVFASTNSQAANITLAITEYFFQSTFNSVLYGWTPEAFPSYIRGTASGMASFFGRLFSIIAPVAAQSMLPALPPDQIPWVYYAKLLYMGGGVAFGATAALILLPQGSVDKDNM